MSFHDKTTHAAKGKWRGILLALGLPESCLKDSHGPCPMCGGKDRFRWDNREGRGTYICGQCGAGDGMRLAIEYTGLPFRDVAQKIDGMVGNIKSDPARKEINPADRVAILRKTYLETQPIQPGDLAYRYLASRGLDDASYADALRFAPALRDGEGGIRPAMVAMVGVYGQPKFVSMHRTFLAKDGSTKAEMAAPRKMMPGELPEGACVRLSDYRPGQVLGIAEGIETALSASEMFRLPVWSAINSAILKKWLPPEGCTEVVIFGDNDPKFGGQSAAYALAHRLAVRGIKATVQLPEIAGQDFNDEYQARREMVRK